MRNLTLKNSKKKDGAIIKNPYFIILILNMFLYFHFLFMLTFYFYKFLYVTKSFTRNDREKKEIVFSSSFTDYHQKF